jgi:hypothetical protein
MVMAPPLPGYRHFMSERDPQDPAWQPVEEAGGGESEGFEEAERELIEHAEHGDPGPDPSTDAFPPEEESEAEYGEADEEEPPDA